jgi:monoamine oxidase
VFVLHHLTHLLMLVMRKSCIVVGGGLAGLTCAREICRRQDNDISVTVVDCGDRYGGRIRTVNGVDMGAAWSWQSDCELRKLVRDLGIELEAQYVKGSALVETSTGSLQIIRDNVSPAGDGCTRFKGGSNEIIHHLVDDLESKGVNLTLNHIVCSVHQESSTDAVTVTMRSLDTDEQQQLQADVVVIAVPPRAIINTIDFTPALPASKVDAMAGTDTWMQSTGKVGFIYSEPFWRSDSRQLSGTVFSERGPMSQIWDNSSSSGDVYALCGFVFGHVDLELLARGDETAVRESSILQQLVHIFGPSAANPEKICFQSWVQVDTPAGPDGPGRRGDIAQVSYGDSRLYDSHGTGDRIIFSGTETARGEHGHMNGAVIAGKRAASDVMRVLHH